METIETPHICSKEGCPTRNVSGNKVHCFICSGVFYGRCFGIDEDIYDAFAPKCPFDAHSNIQFICSTCIKRPKSTNKRTEPAKTAPTESNTPIILNKLTEIELRLSELYCLGMETGEQCRHIQSDLAKCKPGLSFSDVLRQNNGSPQFQQNVSKGLSKNISPPTRPQAAKRSRAEPKPQSNQPKSNLAVTPSSARSTLNRATQPKQAARPAPLVGTSNAEIGIVTVQAVPRSIKAKFDKSIWASRFHPDTTVDQVTSLLMQIAKFDDMTQFFCKKLVKRDADLSMLHFVSFKIDLNEEHFIRLMDPEIWPKDVHIREFSTEGRAEPKRLSTNIANLSTHSNLLDFENLMDVEQSNNGGQSAPSKSLTQSSSVDPNANANPIASTSTFSPSNAN